MAYCSNCGHEIKEGAKYCESCGEPTNYNNNMSKRKEEYIGKVNKCPACGTEIPSFTAICPGCGHEINSVESSSVIKDFTDKIGQCDIKIANSNSVPKKGWKTWGKGIKFLWVLLNIYTCCIPLAIYLVLPLLGISSMSILTPEETEKAELINNYSFPNDRGSILEGLLYIKSQIISLSSEKIDRNNYRWIKIWKRKATQLYDKSEILFKDDTIAKKTYNEIIEVERKVKKSLFKRFVIVALVALLLLGWFLFFRFGDSVQDSIKEQNATFKWPKSGIATQIPSPPSNKGEISYNDEDNFMVEVRNISEEQYNRYKEDCKQAGFVIDSDITNSRYEAYNDEGYDLTLYYYDSKISIAIDAPEPMDEIDWPKSNIAKNVPVPKSLYGKIDWEDSDGFVILIGNTSEKEYKKYVDNCIDHGFKVDYSRTKKTFQAKDSEGRSINLDYKGNNIMFIRVDAPESDEEEEDDNF